MDVGVSLLAVYLMCLQFTGLAANLSDRMDPVRHCVALAGTKVTIKCIASGNASFVKVLFNGMKVISSCNSTELQRNNSSERVCTHTIGPVDEESEGNYTCEQTLHGNADTSESMVLCVHVQQPYINILDLTTGSLVSSTDATCIPLETERTFECRVHGVSPDVSIAWVFGEEFESLRQSTSEYDGLATVSSNFTVANTPNTGQMKNLTCYVKGHRDVNLASTIQLIFCSGFKRHVHIFLLTLNAITLVAATTVAIALCKHATRTKQD